MFGEAEDKSQMVQSRIRRASHKAIAAVYERDSFWGGVFLSQRRDQTVCRHSAGKEAGYGDWQNVRLEERGRTEK